MCIKGRARAVNQETGEVVASNWAISLSVEAYLNALANLNRNVDTQRNY